jgi:hypothetical protein
LIIPFAWGGYRLFVLTDSHKLATGTELVNPGPDASAILCDLRHGASGDAINDVAGTVEILKLRGQDVLVRVNLSGRRGEWSYRGKRWFEREGTPIRQPRSVG